MRESHLRPLSTGSRGRRSAQVFKAALIYFGVVFGTGFVLGTIRVLWSVPRFGERNAELLEQPVMLIAVILAARWTVRHTRSAFMPIENLVIGLIALTLLVVAELLVVLELRESPDLRVRPNPRSGIWHSLSVNAWSLCAYAMACFARRGASIKEELTC